VVKPVKTQTRKSKKPRGLPLASLAMSSISTETAKKVTLDLQNQGS